MEYAKSWRERVESLSLQLYFCTFASVRVTPISKAMQTTAIGTVANSLPENEVILLTLLISRRYIHYIDLQKISKQSENQAADAASESYEQY